MKNINVQMGPIKTSTTKSTICRVGYALNQKKLRKSKRQKTDCPSSSASTLWQGGGLADIIFGFNNEGQPLDDVQFVQFTTDFKSSNTDNKLHGISTEDNEIEFDDNNHYDVIIHKLTEDLEKVNEPSSVAKINKLQSYLKSHPNTVIVDPLDSVRKVTSRVRSCENISDIKSTLFECNGVVCHLSQPNYFVVPDMGLIRDEKKFASTMKKSNISFPIICKPAIACGTADAHIMSVVLRESDLSIISTPCIVQQYYNHNSQLYKVYVIGEDVMVFRRPSLPNLTSDDESTAQHKLHNLTTTEFVASNIDSSSSGNDSNHKCENIMNQSPYRLKSVIFDSRLTYPTLLDFLDYADPAACVSTASSSDSIEGNEHDNCLSNGNNGHSNGSNSSKKRKPKLDGMSHSPSSSPPISRDELNDDELPVPLECFKQAARLMSAQFGLTLFGFDVIFNHQHDMESNQNLNIVLSSVSSSSSSSSSSPIKSSAVDDTSVTHLHSCSPISLIVVDVNYFPSYKEVSDFPIRLRRFLKALKSSAKLGNADNNNNNHDE